MDVDASFSLDFIFLFVSVIFMMLFERKNEIYICFFFFCVLQTSEISCCVCSVTILLYKHLETAEEVSFSLREYTIRYFLLLMVSEVDYIWEGVLDQSL